ncbi:MAG: polyribonucleotide nucleotidyltransferase [bacterium]
MITSKDKVIGESKLSIETGKIAKQADGSVLVRYGETVILATAVASKEPVENRGFFPLTVEYREKSYAAGKIPGGFFKREGRPQEKEVLSARLIDRPIRPLFPKEFMHEVQIAITVLSSDKENDPDVLGTIGASTALMISDIPFNGPIASVRVGRVEEKLIINPVFSQLENSDVDIVIAASEDAIAMVEGESREVSEEELIEILEFGHEAIKQIITLQKDIISEVGREKQKVEAEDEDQNLIKKVRKKAFPGLKEALKIKGKIERSKTKSEILKSVQESLQEDYPESEQLIGEIFYDIEKELMRNMILQEKVRIDGRGYEDIRKVECEVALLPRTHGSALFTRGETQSLAVTTLGTKVDEQKIERLEGSSWKSYTLHYNFPPYSVGEIRPFRGPGRREIGHGNLAERALKPVIPIDDLFPYTIRVVSDIMESNGSSSMATVCAGSLSLMDAGVPMKSAVAGIAMGMVKEGDEVAILTDILGDEDHCGDMDFKVAGTRKGITAFQMDIKITGISFEHMKKALDQAHDARMKLLDIMDQTIERPRENISLYAPRIQSIQLDQNDIGLVIGPGGKTIRDIVERSGAEVNIDDDGVVQITSEDKESCDTARNIIEELTRKPERGKIYKGKVKKITNFGAFVEILPGKEGLLHISEIANEHVSKVENYLKLGDEIEVKLINIDPEGKLKLSRKAALNEHK